MTLPVMDDWKKETVSDSVGCEFAQFHNFSFLKRREKIGSIGAWEELQPGEERTFEFVITWYFPNRVKAWIEFDEDYEKFQRGEYGTVRNYYATKFTDAWDVAKYVYHNKERLDPTAENLPMLCSIRLHYLIMWWML